MPSGDISFPRAREIWKGEMASRLEERNGMIETVLERLEAAGFRPDPMFDRLCLDEAIINAIVHGNREDPAKRVVVRVCGEANRWGVEITDEGAGFDWERLRRQIDEGLDPARPSRRGIALILASGAEVDFLAGGRTMRIVRTSE